ncbi:TPA: hypothetical protein VDW08_003757 [Pseudomonas aeruginosa]|nr:hypothetical protein [Pseudomonas aeruginosa]
MSKELNKAPVEQAGGDEREAKPGLFCRDCGDRLAVRGVCSIYCPKCEKGDGGSDSSGVPAEAAPPESVALLYRRSDGNDRAWSVTCDPHYMEFFRKADGYESKLLVDAALAQPSPAPELAERGTQHRFSTAEQTCRHDFAGVWWNDNGETKTGRECRHCGFFVADVIKAQAEQAGGDERVKCAVCVDSGKVYDISGEGPWKCYACTGSHEVIGYANGDELDNMLDDRTAVLSPVKTSFHTVPVYREARAALAQPSPVQAEKAEAERPEVVARVVHSNPVVLDQCAPLNANDEMMTVAQHAASVARWAEMFNRVEQERDAALARVAELTATRNRYGVDAHYFNKNLQRILRDFESFTPDELARSLIILAKVADEKVVAQHSVPDELRAICMLVAETGIKYGCGRHRAVAADECRAVVNAVLNADLSVGRACEYAGCCEKAHPGTSLCIAHHSKKAREQLLAAAPGKEVGHE